MLTIQFDLHYVPLLAQTLRNLRRSNRNKNKLDDMLEVNLSIAFASFEKIYKQLLVAMLDDEDNFDLEDFIKTKKAKKNARLLYFQIFRISLYAMPYILQFFQNCDETLSKAVIDGLIPEEFYKFQVEKDAVQYKMLKNHTNIFKRFFKEPDHNIPMFSASGIHPHGVIEFNWEYHECICDNKED